MKKFKFNCPCCGKSITFIIPEKDDPINGVKADYIIFEDADSEVKDA